ncbi:MAG TPA: tRNA epoxyqueuosine(34) reductase QueG [Firmicutes bacterium]|nr:tRNA epoxyqueuosine(34) reductase QueG [Bacillota bacterium]
MLHDADIIEYGYSLGFSIIGAASAEPFFNEKKILKARLSAEELSEEKLLPRIYPHLTLPGAKTIIAVGLSYNLPFPEKPADLPRGRLARFACLPDYHSVLRNKMTALGDFLAQKISGLKYKCQVDQGPLLDRAVAFRAGLGFWGKNNCLINPRFGSFVFLGEILIDQYCEPSSPVLAKRKNCQGCEKCIKTCPTGALSPNYLDKSLCLSAISQSKGFIPIPLRKAMGDRLYGCDTCQEVCPHNHGKPLLKAKEFIEHEFDPFPELLPLINLTKSAFKARFFHTALYWRGFKVLRRNAIIVAGNTHCQEALPSLERLLNHDNDRETRQYAAWAIGKIGGINAKTILEKALKAETMYEVKEEIGIALGNLA